MIPDLRTHVLDTGPLSHFARGQWLGVLKAVLHDVRVLIPDVVEQELRNGIGSFPFLQAVLEADWIEVVPLDTPMAERPTTPGTAEAAVTAGSD